MFSIANDVYANACASLYWNISDLTHLLCFAVVWFMDILDFCMRIYIHRLYVCIRRKNET